MRGGRDPGGRVVRDQAAARADDDRAGGHRDAAVRVGAGDEVYGDNGPLRSWLEDQGLRYVLAVACDHHVPAGAGKTLRADTLAARLPARAWQRISAGPGAKGHRY